MKGKCQVLRWKVGLQKHHNAPFNLCFKVFIQVRGNMINHLLHFAEITTLCTSYYFGCGQAI